MSEIRVPYGTDSLSATIGMNHLQGVYKDKALLGLPNPEQELKERLEEFLPCNLSNRRVSIIVDDVTRPTPSRRLIEVILEGLNQRGVPDSTIGIFVARGLHRVHNTLDLERLLGKRLLERVNVTVSNPDGGYTSLGRTPYGTEVSICNAFLESDLRITTGHISPHQFAGYTGGRKSIVPGIASRDTIVAHHGRWCFHPNSIMGQLKENYHHLDMEAAAVMAGVDLIVNVILNSCTEIAYLAVGDLKNAHLQGVERLDQAVKVVFERRHPIVIASPNGYPTDIDLRTAQKALPAAEIAVEPGGCIILVAECREGLGITKEYLELFKGISDPMVAMARAKEIMDCVGYSQTMMQAYLFARALSKANIIVVSENIDGDLARSCLLEQASSLNDAILRAWSIIGKREPVVVFPNAPALIPLIETQ
jgi:nickel-dependent lactate racemase